MNAIYDMIEFGKFDFQGGNIMDNIKTEKTNDFLMYKGFPLVRKGNDIYFGNPSDEFVVWIQILSADKVGGVDVATKLKVYRMLTDESINALKRITKQVEKESLYDALEIASIWLTRKKA